MVWENWSEEGSRSSCQQLNVNEYSDGKHVTDLFGEKIPSEDFQ